MMPFDENEIYTFKPKKKRWNAYTILIGFTIGYFGAHILLWIATSILR